MGKNKANRQFQFQLFGREHTCNNVRVTILAALKRTHLSTYVVQYINAEITGKLGSLTHPRNTPLLLYKHRRPGRTAVSHGQREGPVVPQVAVKLVLKLSSPDGLAPGAVSERIALDNVQ